MQKNGKDDVELVNSSGSKFLGDLLRNVLLGAFDGV
jgi:hypothetical protein